MAVASVKLNLPNPSSSSVSAQANDGPTSDSTGFPDTLKTLLGNSSTAQLSTQKGTKASGSGASTSDPPPLDTGPGLESGGNLNKGASSAKTIEALTPQDQNSERKPKQANDPVQASDFVLTNFAPAYAIGTADTSAITASPVSQVGQSSAVTDGKPNSSVANVSTPGQLIPKNQGNAPASFPDNQSQLLSSISDGGDLANGSEVATYELSASQGSKSLSSITISPAGNDLAQLAASSAVGPLKDSTQGQIQVTTNQISSPPTQDQLGLKIQSPMSRISKNSSASIGDVNQPKGDPRSDSLAQKGAPSPASAGIGLATLDSAPQPGSVSETSMNLGLANGSTSGIKQEVAIGNSRANSVLQGSSSSLTLRDNQATNPALAVASEPISSHATSPNTKVNDKKSGDNDLANSTVSAQSDLEPNPVQGALVNVKSESLLKPANAHVQGAETKVTGSSTFITPDKGGSISVSQSDRTTAINLGGKESNPVLATSASGQSQLAPIDLSQSALVVKQMTERIQLLAASRNGEAVMVQISPKDLGSITMTVNAIGKNISTLIAADNATVRHELNNNRSEIELALVQKGYGVASVSVTAQPTNSSANPQPTGQQLNQNLSQQGGSQGQNSGHSRQSPTATPSSGSSLQRELTATTPTLQYAKGNSRIDMRA